MQEIMADLHVKELRRGQLQVDLINARCEASALRGLLKRAKVADAQCVPPVGEVVLPAKADRPAARSACVDSDSGSAAPAVAKSDRIEEVGERGGDDAEGAAECSDNGVEAGDQDESRVDTAGDTSAASVAAPVARPDEGDAMKSMNSGDRAGCGGGVAGDATKGGDDVESGDRGVRGGDCADDAVVSGDDEKSSDRGGAVATQPTTRPRAETTRSPATGWSAVVALPRSQPGAATARSPVTRMSRVDDAYELQVLMTWT